MELPNKQKWKKLLDKAGYTEEDQPIEIYLEVIGDFLYKLEFKKFNNHKKIIISGDNPIKNYLILNYKTNTNILKIYYTPLNYHDKKINYILVIKPAKDYYDIETFISKKYVDLIRIFTQYQFDYETYTTKQANSYGISSEYELIYDYDQPQHEENFLDLEFQNEPDI